MASFMDKVNCHKIVKRQFTFNHQEISIKKVTDHLEKKTIKKIDHYGVINFPWLVTDEFSHLRGMFHMLQPFNCFKVCLSYVEF